MHDEHRPPSPVPPPFPSFSRTLSARVATFNQRVVAEGDALAEDVKRLLADLKKADAAAPPPAARGAASDDDDDGPCHVAPTLDAARSVVAGRGPGGDLRVLARGGRPPWLLGALAGRSLHCVTRSRKAAAALKEEYHAFRDRGGVILTAASLALLAGLHRARARAAASASLTLAPPLMVGTQALLAWLLYFYTALALREMVLVVNGSNIRPWWIRHHVWSAATVVLTLTLPVDSPSVQVFVWKLLVWTAAQGGVMMLQNRYQRRRMYTRIALGRAAAMDVVSGESSGAAGQLLVLYPFLFGLQASQVAIGAQMVGATAAAALSPEGWLDPEARESDLRGSRGVAVAGCAMVVMGLANFYHTVLTVRDKQKTRAARTGRGTLGGSAGARPVSAGRPPLPRPPSGAKVGGA